MIGIQDHTHGETDMHLGLSRMYKYKYTNKHTDVNHKQILQAYIAPVYTYSTNAHTHRII